MELDLRYCNFIHRKIRQWAFAESPANYFADVLFRFIRLWDQLWDNVWCAKCHKPVSWDELVVNWGYCDECFSADYEEYLRNRKQA